MINKKNILGWLNLALRMALSFGLIFVVNYFLGEKSVAIWIVYITIIATINSIDGLLSQFYIRDIISSTWNIENGNKKCSFHSQKILYAIISIFLFGIVCSTLKIKTFYLLQTSFLFSIYMISRVVDSRFKAFFETSYVQKVEIIINFSLLIYLSILICVVTSIEQFIVLHLLGLTSSMSYKAYAVFRSEGFKIYNLRSHNFIKYFDFDRDMVRTITISFGSGLSINLSLLSMQATIPGGVNTEFLFTYRVASLICEIISIPVIVRIPEITRLINLNDNQKARDIFFKNYKQTIFLCFITMTITFSLKEVWNELMPNKLHLTTTYVLFFIFGSWFFERIATLLSQYFLSSKLYYIYKYYLLYIFLIIFSIILSSLYQKEEFFSVATFIINFYLSIQIYKNWRKGHVHEI